MKDMTKTLNIKMTLLSDTIFGNGRSIPGQEDISVLRDTNGFPYYRGSTFKGIFREELRRYLGWRNMSGDKVKEICTRLLGAEGSEEETGGNMIFSDLMLSNAVKATVLAEMGSDETAVLDAFTHIRTFTRIGSEGTVDYGTLRMSRCVNKDLIFYGTIICEDHDVAQVKEVLGLMKWIGTMRNRGFGHIRVDVM